MYKHPKTDKNLMPKSVNEGRGNSEQVSYQNQYLKGRNSERLFQEQFQKQNYIVDENANALTNVLMNLAFTSIVSFLVGTLFFVAQRNESSLPSVPVPNGSPAQSAEKKTTIFDRTVDNLQELVPTPQKQAGKGTLKSMFLALREVDS
ncbi:hypothetical protein [Coleofasciculus sp. FACHB-1120]|uniref:hypothetical protein n=1 Tax=Coleofasciculus sp. FACHB-1120 TaxID=2692783 RepID=UPI001687A160|nr:hypothetical protein [Coleofasciculus sp. FACHB-1120]MBD2744052.1 hypothetical protein [Coleofasciculus sp. FACHB-1120]